MIKKNFSFVNLGKKEITSEHADMRKMSSFQRYTQ